MGRFSAKLRLLRSVRKNLQLAGAILFPLFFSSCQEKRASVAFNTEVEPILAEYCFDCHADGMDEGEIDFDAFESHEALVADIDFWEGIYVNLNSSLMPPSDKPKPGDEDKARVMTWIEDKVFQIDYQNPDPGRPVVSRLNRDEYNRTIRDLFGADLQPAAAFPEDDTGYGFDNIGEVLTLSPALLEKYFAATTDILDQVMVTAPPKPKRTIVNPGSFVKRKGGPDPGGTMASNGTLGVQFQPKGDGEYLLKVRARGSRAKNEWPIMRVSVENGPSKDVRVDSANTKEFEFPVRLRKDQQRWIDVSFINDLYDPKAKDRNQRDRNLYLSGIEVTGPLVQELPKPGPAHQRILALADEGTTDESERAAQIISRFAALAWRRPHDSEAENSVQRLMEFYERERNAGGSFDEGIKIALQGILISPRFLFRGERVADSGAKKGSVPIDEFSLASRLSYFLWSSMPDQELLDLAKSGNLRAQLDQQVSRMLGDPKAKALTRNFAGQWLQLRNLQLATPNPGQFKSWNDDLREDLRMETELFFEFIMRENRPVLDFLDADYSFLNSRLARHYGTNEISGNEFQRVMFTPEQRKTRGGLLTHGSILTITSNPTRTSAVNRGNYVLENLLGTPPPHPPEDLEIPDLDEAKKSGKAPKTLRAQLEVHREKAICSSCHSRMDPIGFGMENYDAIGRWREKENGQSIDASGTLYTGEEFSGAAELRTILAQEKSDSFIRCFSEKMLTYALGRGLEYYDQPAINEISSKALEKDARFHEVVKAIVHSVPFQRTRSE